MTELVPRQLLCLTVFGYKRASLNEIELCHFQVNRHANMISGLMEKYGIISYTVTHNADKPSALLYRLFDPKRVSFADYDFIVQIMFPDIECYLRLRSDPLYIEQLAKDHLTFSDPTDEAKKTRMTLGYVHEVVRDGKVTYVGDNSKNACADYSKQFDEDTGSFRSQNVSRGVH